MYSSPTCLSSAAAAAACGCLFYEGHIFYLYIYLWRYMCVSVDLVEFFVAVLGVLLNSLFVPHLLDPSLTSQ